MKIEFKQSFAIDMHEYKIKKKGKSEIADVPAYFCFVAFFISLIKSGGIKVLGVCQKEFKDVPEEYYKAKISQEDLEFMHNILENADVDAEDDSEEGKEDEEISNPIPPTDDSKPNDEGKSEDEKPESTEQSEESKEVEDGEKLPTSEESEINSEVSEEVKEISEDEKEFNHLEEKKLRLTNKEKKRHAELKAKIGKV